MNSIHNRMPRARAVAGGEWAGKGEDRSPPVFPLRPVALNQNQNQKFIGMPRSILLVSILEFSTMTLDCSLTHDNYRHTEFQYG